MTGKMGSFTQVLELFGYNYFEKSDIKGQSTLIHLLDHLEEDELISLTKNCGQPAYRAAQLRQWVVATRAGGFDEMSNLPKKFRDELTKQTQLWTSQVVKHTKAEDGTEKILLQLADGGQIECVLLRDGHRITICISTQVGCAMGCVFCASGLDGVDRNLTTGEIIEQMLLLQRLLPEDQRLSHIVVMGMGEPLANIDSLLPALDFASSPDGLGIGARRITISTVGLPAAIDKLSDINARYNLAVSLHAPNDELRNEIVPINKNIGIQEILKASDHYFEVSGRQLTFEYVLLYKLNDRPEHARQLAELLKNRQAMLNVIPYNPVEGLPYKTPSNNAQHDFRRVLEDAGITVKFRHRKGDKINAACGQLRRSNADLVQIEEPEQSESSD
ncbi:MAG: 23S rRNA (adenine(2503)-C(2))-methyltransferase RlmN [Pirellulales bacterium]